MIPNHTRLLEEVRTHMKVTEFARPWTGGRAQISAMDCIPLRAWDCAFLPGAHTLGLVPQQMVEFLVQGEGLELSELPS